MSPQGWLGLVIALALAGWLLTEHYEEKGYAKCEADHAEEIEKVQKELKQLRAERAEERERYERALAGARARERAHVAGAPGVAAWWGTPVPRCAVAYAYGRVHEDCQGAVWPGP